MNMFLGACAFPAGVAALVQDRQLHLLGYSSVPGTLTETLKGLIFVFYFSPSVEESSVKVFGDCVGVGGRRTCCCTFAAFWKCLTQQC